MTDKEMVEAYFLNMEKKLCADIEQSYRRERIAMRIAMWSAYGLIYVVYGFVELKTIGFTPLFLIYFIPLTATLYLFLNLQDTVVKKLRVRQESESESLRLGIKQMRKDAGL
jgi:hypothetical protein